MGYLNVPERVVYEAAKFRSNLTDIVALVMKPDKTVVGPFALAEAKPLLVGRYYFDFLSTVADQVGTYLVAFISPTENIQTTGTFSLYLIPGSVPDPRLEYLDAYVSSRATESDLLILLQRLTADRAANLDLITGSISSGGSSGSSLSDLDSVIGIVEDVECIVGIVTDMPQ